MIPKIKKLFISYRSNDATKVDKIAKDLSLLKYDDGTPRYTTWQDKHNLPPASPNWWDAIVDAIAGCDIFVFHLSRASLQSVVCLAELDYAHKRNRPIIPVVLDGEFFINPQSDKPDLSPETWVLIPDWLRDRQFLFYTETDFLVQFEVAVGVFDRNLPRDIHAPRPLNPDKTSGHGTNHALYDAACDYAERLAFADAEKHFEPLVTRNDPDYGNYAAQWIEIIRKYAELIEITSRRSALVILNKRVAEYRALFPNDAVRDIFDPKDIASREPTPEEIAEKERIAYEIAEKQRIAREKAEAERIAREKTEKERIAREKAEAERIARKKEEEERIAREKAEKERITREKAEAERIARKKEEAERIATEKAEAEKKYQQVEEALYLVESAFKNDSVIEAAKVWEKLPYRYATREQEERKNKLYETYIVAKKGKLKIRAYNPLDWLRTYLWAFFKHEQVARHAWEENESAQAIWGWLISNMLLLPLLAPILAIYLKILSWSVDESINNWSLLASIVVWVIAYIGCLLAPEILNDIYTAVAFSVGGGVTVVAMLAGLDWDSAISVILLVTSVMMFSHLIYCDTQGFGSVDSWLIETAGVIFIVMVSHMVLGDIHNWDFRIVVGITVLIFIPVVGFSSFFGVLGFLVSVIFSAAIIFALISFNIIHTVSAIVIGISIGTLLGLLYWLIIYSGLRFAVPLIISRRSNLFLSALRVILSLFWPASFAGLIYIIFF